MLSQGFFHNLCCRTNGLLGKRYCHDELTAVNSAGDSGCTGPGHDPVQVFLGFPWTPRDENRNHVIILTYCLTEIGIEAKIAGRQHKGVGSGVAVLFLPYAAAFDKAAAWRSTENTVRGRHRIVVCCRFDGAVDANGPGFKEFKR